MKLTWYGTAAVMMESEGYRIVFDPFLGLPLLDNSLRRRLLAAHYRSADAVLVTHGHFDHIYHIPQLFNNSDVEIYASSTPCRTLYSEGVEKDRLHRISPGESFTLGGFTIRVYQGRHCKFDLGVAVKTFCKSDTVLHPMRLLKLWRLNKSYPENGETLFFEIEAEGKRVQLMGSMGMAPYVDYPTGADALILPFQGTGDPARTVKPIIARLQPKAVFLDHYDDAFPPLSTQIKTDDFVSELFAHRIPAAAMKPGENYSLLEINLF